MPATRNQTTGPSEAWFAERWGGVATGDRAARDALILQYAPLVKYVAGKIWATLPNHIDRSDLVSYGMFGLIRAIERFDPAHGARFEGFAVPHIRGAILDELRSMDWVPRSVRSKARQVDRATTALEGELGRAPSEDELASRLAVQVDDLRVTLHQMERTRLIELDRPLAGEGGDSLTGADTLAVDDGDPSDLVDEAELRRLLAQHLGALQERDRTVVALYYFEGMSQAQIAEVLGVSEARVSQLRSRALVSLRAALGGALAV